MYIRHLELINSQSGNYRIFRGPVVAVNKFYTNADEAREVLAKQENMIEGKTAFDTEIGGVVTCARFYEVPWLFLKSVNYEVGKSDQLLSHVRQGVVAQPKIGELIKQLFVLLATSVEDPY